jgi:hypothetical protein
MISCFDSMGWGRRPSVWRFSFFPTAVRQLLVLVKKWRIFRETMAGKPGRSGRPRKSLSQHLLAGTYRQDRHGPLPQGLDGNVVPMPTQTSVDDEAKQEILSGLQGVAREVASRMLAELGGWETTKLRTLRAYALSTARLEKLQREQTPSMDLYREARLNLQLLAALDIEWEG